MLWIPTLQSYGTKSTLSHRCKPLGAGRCPTASITLLYLLFGQFKNPTGSKGFYSVNHSPKVPSKAFDMSAGFFLPKAQHSDWPIDIENIKFFLTVGSKRMVKG